MINLKELKEILKSDKLNLPQNFTKQDIINLLLKDKTYKTYKYFIENYNMEDALNCLNKLFILVNINPNVRMFIEIITQIPELNDYCKKYYQNNSELIDELGELNLDEIPDNNFIFNIIYAYGIKTNILKTDDKAIEENETIQKIKEGNNELLTEWLEKNKRLIYSVVKKYIGNGIEFDDLFQEGTIGVLNAVEHYDPDRGYKFTTYALWWIRQAIQRYIADNRRTIRIPVYMGDFINKINRVKNELEEKLGFEPTIIDIANELNVNPKKIEFAMEHTKEILSLDKKSEQNDDERELSNFVPAKTYTDEEVMKNIKKEEVYKFISNSGLSERDKKIIFLRFGLLDGKERTLEEVGKVFGVTRERIRQIEAKALKRLRNNRNRYKVIDLMDTEADPKNIGITKKEKNKQKKKTKETESDNMAFYDPNKRYITSAYRKNGPVITYFGKKEEKEQAKQEQKKEEIIEENKGKYSMTENKKIKLDNLYAYFKEKYGADEALVDKMLEWLKAYPKDIEILKIKYGEDFKNPVNNELTKEQNQYFYGNTLARMKKYIEKALNIKKQKKSNQSKPVITTNNNQDSEEVVSTETLLNNIKQKTSNDYYERILKQYSITDITIISLKYGEKFGIVDFSTKDIADMLGLEIDYVRKVCNNFLNNVKDEISNIVSNELNNVIILSKKKKD